VRELERSTVGACSQARDQLLSLEVRIEQHWDALISAFAHTGFEALRRQIVHGDLSPVNIVFGPTGKMTLIDWDCVHMGHRIYDALGDVLNRPPDRMDQPVRFCRNEVAEYLAGYESTIAEPLTAGERRLIPAFCLARQLEDLRQRLQVIPNLESSQDATYARLIQIRMEMMDQIELN
jgi:Ser/Thr protein kinase RdoA (MazF antagonist)